MYHFYIVSVARRFVQTVQRQISFLHLAKSFREVLGDKTIASNLVNELDMVDIKSIGAQAVYTTVDCTKDQIELHEQCKTSWTEKSSVENYFYNFYYFMFRIISYT